MIGKLTGTVDEVSGDSAIFDVGGVGYTIFGSSRTLARLAQAGPAVSLYIETHVREDHIHLYGFLERVERDWFRLLLTVQGVGARVALSILGVLSPGELGTAIAAQDKAVRLATRLARQKKFAEANEALLEVLGDVLR